MADTVIEVIDPVRGEILARTRIERTALLPVGPRSYWFLEEDSATGLVRIRIRHLSLQGR